MDFGVAAALGATDRKSGTLGYAPPEQLAGEKVDSSVDIYALAVTLSECLLGQPVFVGHNSQEIELAQKELAFLSWPTDAPQELRDLLLRAMDLKAEIEQEAAKNFRLALCSSFFVQ